MDILTQLKALHMKATPKRLAILEILAEASGYLGPEEVWQKMKTSFKSIGLPTVYRNLEDLSKGEVIIKVLHPDRKLYYFYCRNAGHHHHFVCVSCRKVEDIQFCGMREIEDEVKNSLKGQVVSHLFQVYGFCNTCLKNKAMSI
jgi:Fe2+ or Zn2+ uptake regulation protein